MSRAALRGEAPWHPDDDADDGLARISGAKHPGREVPNAVWRITAGHAGPGRLWRTLARHLDRTHAKSESESVGPSRPAARDPKWGGIRVSGFQAAGIRADGCPWVCTDGKGRACVITRADAASHAIRVACDYKASLRVTLARGGVCAKRVSSFTSRFKILAQPLAAQRAGPLAHTRTRNRIVRTARPGQPGTGAAVTRMVTRMVGPEQVPQ
jgi:hypothetical protein